jgi:glycosyltransferase involved in cell wall biosynthesis
MRLALIQGYYSTHTRGPYNVAAIDKHDLSGSESFYFNTVKGLAAKGHYVEAHGFWTAPHEDGNIKYVPFTVKDRTANFTFEDPWSYEAAIVWNEPDGLSAFPYEVKKVCVQQLNDFLYCHTDFKKHMDLVLCPSNRHMEHLIAQDSLDPAKCGVLSNCISNEDNFTGPEDHNNHKIVYCSSPDRGLHWLAEFFPKVRQRVPDAELHIFYRLQDWLNNFNGHWGNDQPYKEFGFRARYITEFLRRMGSEGQNGVYLHGPVSNKRMAEELMGARMLAYPCDTARFTEGFGVSVLDACTAGALPLISDVDSFGGVYGGVADMIPGRPKDNRQAWVDAIVRGLTDDKHHQEVTARCKAFAKDFTRDSRVELLLRYISRMEKKL